jgi:hypothetical protein
MHVKLQVEYSVKIMNRGGWKNIYIYIYIYKHTLHYHYFVDPLLHIFFSGDLSILDNARILSLT